MEWRNAREGERGGLGPLKLGCLGHIDLQFFSALSSLFLSLSPLSVSLFPFPLLSPSSTPSLCKPQSVLSVPLSVFLLFLVMFVLKILTFYDCAFSQIFLSPHSLYFSFLFISPISKHTFKDIHPPKS